MNENARECVNYYYPYEGIELNWTENANLINYLNYERHKIAIAKCKIPLNRLDGNIIPYFHKPPPSPQLNE